MPPIEESPRESAACVDRATYDLIPVLKGKIREAVAASDCAQASLTRALVHTVRESAGGSDSADGQVQALYAPNMFVLTHIYFPEGREGFSSLHVNTPSHSHVGKVLNWGTSEREIPIPAGPPRLGQMTLEYDDTDQYFRKKFGARTPKGRKMDLLIGPEDGKESLFQIPASGVIQDAKFPPGKMQLFVQDLRYKWLQKLFPNLIDSTNFPNLPESSRNAFYPFVFGIVSSVGFGDQGAIALVHIDTVNHRYAIARHVVASVTVYRKTAEEASFTVVTSGYTLVTETRTIKNVSYDLTYVQFDSDQGDAEIRADVSGLNAYAGWGIIPPQTGVSRNVIDQVIALLYFVQRVERVLPNYDLYAFQTVRNQFIAKGWTSDFAIVDQCTPEVALSRLLGAFLIHWFPNRSDQLRVVMTTDETPATAPIFGDYHKILRESEMIELAQDTKNRINYRFAPSYAQSDNWSKDTYDNVTDQQNMLDMDGNPIIEPEEVDLWPVRDAAVAEDIAVEWSRWRSQTAQRFQFKLDMPRNLTKVDLAKDFLATHYGGLADGGWVRERFIPFKVVDDYDAFQFIVDAIRRPASDNALCSYSEQSYIDRLAFSGTFSVPGPEWEAVSAIFRHGAPVVGSFSPTHSHLETSDGVLELVQNAVHPESEDVPGSYPLPYEWMMAVSRHFLPSLRDQRCTVIYKSGSRYSGFAGPCVRVVNEDGGNIWRGYLAQILPGYPSAQDSIAITSFCFDYGPDGRWPGTLIDGDGNRAHGAGAPNVSCFVPTDVTIPTGTSGFWEGTLQDGDEITLIACCSSPTHLFVTLNGELILFGHSTAGGPFTELESTAGRPAVLATGGIGNFPDEPDAQAGQPLRLKGWSAASMMREIEIWV